MELVRLILLPVTLHKILQGPYGQRVAQDKLSRGNHTWYGRGGTAASAAMSLTSKFYEYSIIRYLIGLVGLAYFLFPRLVLKCIH